MMDEFAQYAKVLVEGRRVTGYIRKNRSAIQNADKVGDCERPSQGVGCDFGTDLSKV